jgi:glycosyltransferase involved in cell wall biosynthesis
LTAEEIKNCRIIAEISRTDRTKRKDLLLNAFAEICESYNAFLIITISPEQADLHRELLELIDCHNIGHRVAVLGNVFELVPVIYNIAHIYCTPSVMEGFGMSIQEAAACKIPAVSSELVPFAVEYLLGEQITEAAIPGSDKTLKKGDGAIVVPADSILGLISGLKMLLQDDKLCSEMGQKAFEITIPRFTWKNMTERFLHNALKKPLHNSIKE